MPALNFQKRFAPAVQNGSKRQTIRGPRVDGRPSATKGCRLYLYTGMRTKGCRKLGEAVCTSTSQLVITVEHAILINGRPLRTAAAEDAFAQRDGFDCAEELLNWFVETHGLPFKGSLIEWQPA